MRSAVCGPPLTLFCWEAPAAETELVALGHHGVNWAGATNYHISYHIMYYIIYI